MHILHLQRCKEHNRFIHVIMYYSLTQDLISQCFTFYTMLQNSISILPWAHWMICALVHVPLFLKTFTGASVQVNSLLPDEHCWFFCIFLYRGATSWRTKTWERSASQTRATERRSCTQRAPYQRSQTVDLYYSVYFSIQKQQPDLVSWVAFDIRSQNANIL